MKHLFVILISVLFSFAYGCNGDDGIRVITADEFSDSIKSDTAAVIIDVRTAEEFASGHIAGAVNMDVKSSDKFNEDVKCLDKCNKYYVYCRSGRRSHKAALIIKDAGFDVIDMEGGITAWKNAGLPIVTGTTETE